MSKVFLYSDGGCRGNPGIGAWGYILAFKGVFLFEAGYSAETTNNQMELTAIIRGLEQLSRPCQITLVSDSQYCINGMSKWLIGWKQKNYRNSKKEAVKNEDLWRQLDDLMTQHQFEYEWVKGHSDHLENELCDLLANRMMDMAMNGITEPHVKHRFKGRIEDVSALIDELTLGS